ncbi:MAG TPA: septum formation initiator family protein [Caulobacteraceae bacterium]|jgi:cell division protein FtsB|nr:septum formation initiator family protein [Caulobacteraceae bacterium]
MLAQFRSYIPTAILAFLIFYFGFQALTGERGLLSTHERADELEARVNQLAQLRHVREDLEIRARLLRDDSLSRDLLEERARSRLGVADPRDYVIRISKP